MPVFRSNTVVKTVKNITAFLNLEAGITRSSPPELKRAQGASSEIASHNGQRQAVEQGQSAGEPARVNPEDMVWIFSYGSGRSGTTWVTRMLDSLSGYTLWKSPRVGSLFGEFYYESPITLRNGERPEHILGPDKEKWIKPLRSFILEGATLRYPELLQPDSGFKHLVISDHHGSVGAPLVMEALPESRMIVLMRDPRDVAASTREASKSSGWVRKIEKVDDRTLADINPIAFMKAHVEQNGMSMGKSLQAYEAHKGPKAILKYEDLRADAASAMKETLSALGLPYGEAELARVVKRYSWENIPDKRKGEGKFLRKATPGGWKEDLSEEEVRIVEEGFEDLISEFYPQKAS